MLLRAASTVACALLLLTRASHAQDAAPEPLLTGTALDAHLFPASPTPSSGTLSLVFNGYRRGMIEPCGCINHKLGGIDKEARLEARLQDLQMPFVHADAGGFIKEPTVPHAAQLSDLQMQAFQLMHVDALNVGFHDLGLGLPLLRDWQTSRSLPMISCNLIDETSHTIFAPYRVVTRRVGSREVRVAFIGSTRMRIPQSSRLPQLVPIARTPCFISDPGEALRKYLPELRTKCDVLVLLHYDTRDAARALIEKLTPETGIDILVAGESRGQLASPARIGKTWLVGAGFEGRQVGHLQLQPGEDGITTASTKMVEVLQTLPPVPEFTPLVEQAARLKAQ
jgi:2',3'-cyclic-nucleotide 2'-phosphodiesterase (5'-nucleotidase family)